jgi:hypothetical protein
LRRFIKRLKNILIKSKRCKMRSSGYLLKNYCEDSAIRLEAGGYLIYWQEYALRLYKKEEGAIITP